MELPDIAKSYNYTKDQVDKAKISSTHPIDYACFGLPTDVTVEKNHMIIVLQELENKRNSLYKQPIEEQAKYADAICRAKTADADFVSEQLATGLPLTWLKYYTMSECNLGNLAYSALYAPNEKQRDAAKDAWEKYIKWRKWQPDWFMTLMANTKYGDKSRLWTFCWIVCPLMFLCVLLDR